MLDYHHHSEASVDSETPMVEVCRTAIARGITEIAFTEHMDFITEEPNTGYFDYTRYMTALDAARREFAGDLTVLAAIEIDYCPDFEDEIADWLNGKEFDVVVGSVHYIRGEGNISEPRALDFFRDRTIDEAYDRYFDLVRQSAETGLWDALVKAKTLLVFARGLRAGRLFRLLRFRAERWIRFTDESARYNNEAYPDLLTPCPLRT